MIMTLTEMAKHLNYLKESSNNNIEKEISLLTNCVCSIISVFGESKFNEERFKSIIGVSALL